MPISTISIDELAGINDINDTMSSLDLSSSPNTIDTITLTPLSYSFLNATTNGAVLTAGSNLSNNVWTTSTNGTSAANLHQSGMLSLQGEKADIDINGVSLMKTLTSIQERLNILTPAPELEKDWDQLRELGEQYRKLEAEFEEKSKMWKTLKAMPPPEIE
jgi:hypothetical protein